MSYAILQRGSHNDLASVSVQNTRWQTTRKRKCNLSSISGGGRAAGHADDRRRHLPTDNPRPGKTEKASNKKERKTETCRTTGRNPRPWRCRSMPGRKARRTLVDTNSGTASRVNMHCAGRRDADGGNLYPCRRRVGPRLRPSQPPIVVALETSNRVRTSKHFAQGALRWLS
jgi:hypothetical protein